MTIFLRTRAILSKMLDDISKTNRVISITVQIIFFVVYGYEIYSNISRLPYLIAYAVLLILSIIGFAFYLTTQKEYKKKHLKVSKRTVRISKYVVNGLMIALNVFSIIKVGSTDLQIILTSLSILSWLVNIVVEAVRIYFERYVELFTVAIEMDIAPITQTVDAVKDLRGTFFTAIDTIPEKIANKIEGKEPVKELSKTEEFIESLSKEYKDELEEERLIKKANQKEESLARKEKQKQELKEHFTVIGTAIKEKMRIKKK